MSSPASAPRSRSECCSSLALTRIDDTLSELVRRIQCEIDADGREARYNLRQERLRGIQTTEFLGFVRTAREECERINIPFTEYDPLLRRAEACFRALCSLRLNHNSDPKEYHDWREVISRLVAFRDSYMARFCPTGAADSAGSSPDSNGPAGPPVEHSFPQTDPESLPEPIRSAFLHAYGAAGRGRLALSKASNLRDDRWGIVPYTPAEIVEDLRRLEEECRAGERLIVRCRDELMRVREVGATPLASAVTAHDAAFAFGRRVRGEFDVLIRTATRQFEGIGSNYRPLDELVQCWPDVLHVLRSTSDPFADLLRDSSTIHAALCREARLAADARGRPTMPDAPKTTNGSEQENNRQSSIPLAEADIPVAKPPARASNQPGRDRQDDILAAIVAADTPLTRPELVEAMKLSTEGKLGHQLAWMVANHVLISIPQRGYWPADRPVPE